MINGFIQCIQGGINNSYGEVLIKQKVHAANAGDGERRLSDVDRGERAEFLDMRVASDPPIEIIK